MNERPWTPITESLPPDGEAVETRAADDAEQVLLLHRTQWWLPDYSIMAVSTPTHWRPQPREFLVPGMFENDAIFAKHAHLKVFIETGTCFGRSVEAALKLGYNDIRSVEAAKDRYEACAELFKGNPAVRLWCGESVATLPEMIADLQQPAVFWLDAHPSGEGSYGDKTGCQTEILKAELQIIAAHPVKNHVILIDDLTRDVELFARQLFPNATVAIYNTEGYQAKVLEMIVRESVPVQNHAVEQI